jgi:drug/metabolite transporter (DMT)-like permease
MTATPAAEGRPLLAAAWMVGAVASFSLMAVAGRAVSLDHDTFEIMLYRSIIGFALVLALGGAFGALREVSPRHMHVHVIRNAFHFTGQNLWFFAITAIPLAQVFALEFTSPIWAALLAAVILGERLTQTRLLAAGLGFLGVLVVARPDFAALQVGQLAALGAAIGFAGSAVFTRKLTRTETTTCILFWLTAMQAVLGLAFAGADGDIALPTAAGLPWLAVIAACGLAAHFCLTTALGLAPAGVVMTMDFARLPAIAVVGVLLYDEPLELAVVLGAALIVGGNWLNLRRPAPAR